MIEILIFIAIIVGAFFLMSLEEKKKTNLAKQDELFRLRHKYFKENYPSVQLLGFMGGDFAVCIYNPDDKYFEYHFEGTRTKANNLYNSYLSSGKKVCGNVCEFIGYRIRGNEELPHLNCIGET